MAQHTPGPWHLTPIAGGYRRTGGFKVDPKDGHGAIAKVSYRYTMTNNLDEGQHNAKLIAAAPALLAALEACRLWLGDDKPMSTAKMWELGAIVRAALAKAGA